MSLPQAAFASVSERDFQAQVIAAAKLLGWHVYHTWNSQHSPEGWPDVFAVRGARAVAFELKSEAGKPTGEQVQWLRDLEAAGIQAMLARPNDIDVVIKVLQSEEAR